MPSQGESSSSVQWPSTKSEKLEEYMLRLYPSEMKEIEEFRSQQKYESNGVMLLDLVRRAREGRMPTVDTAQLEDTDAGDALDQNAGTSTSTMTMSLRSGTSNKRLRSPEMTSPKRSKTAAGDRSMTNEALDNGQYLSTPKSEPTDTFAGPSVKTETVDPSANAIYVVVKDEIDEDQCGDGINRESYGEELESNNVPSLIGLQESVETEDDSNDSRHGNVRANSRSSPPTAEQSTDENNINGYCRRLIRANQASTTEDLACDICRTTIVNLRSTNRESNIITRALTTHALSHTRILAFQCRYCAFRTNAPYKVIEHAKQQHRIIDTWLDDYSDRTEMYSAEIMHALEQCYGRKLERVNPQVRQAQPTALPKASTSDAIPTKPPNPKYAANALCIRLANKCTERGRMQCRLCDITINAVNYKRNFLDPRVGIDHALRHLDKDLFDCSICRYWTSAQIGRGGRNCLSNAHSFACSTDERFEEKLEEHQEVICEMLTRCFDPDAQPKMILVRKQAAASSSRMI